MVKGKLLTKIKCSNPEIKKKWNPKLFQHYGGI